MRFELMTFCTPSKRATSLRYAPKKSGTKSDGDFVELVKTLSRRRGGCQLASEPGRYERPRSSIAQTLDAEVLYPGDGGKPAVHGNDGAGHEAGAIGNQPQGGTHHFLRRG